MMMQAPPEGNAFLAVFNSNGRPDALAVMAVVVLVVYDRTGLIFLKCTWFNVHLIWTGVLVLADAIALVV